MRAFTEVRFEGTEEEIHAAWLSERLKGIGGSDASAVMGLNPYKTPLLVWMEKTGRMIPEDISDNPAVYWGNVLEDVVAAEFAKRHEGWRVRRKNALLRSKEHPFMQASLDREVTDDRGRHGVLECKTAGAHRKGDWEEGIPDYYLPQPIHYLAVTGYEFYAVAVLIGGQDYREYVYERDEKDVKLLIECEEALWHLIETDQMPMPTESSADSAALLDLNPDPGDEYLSELDDDIPEIARYAEACERFKQADDEKRTLANLLRKRIGESKGIETPRYRATWVRSEVARFDQKAFASDHPDVYEHYMTVSARDGGIRIKEVA